MSINLVKTKVKELEELYSYLLTKYLESKGKGQTLTSLYNGVSKLEQGGFEKRSSLQYDSDNDAFVLKYAYVWEWTYEGKAELIIEVKDIAIQSVANPKSYDSVISDKFRLSDSDFQQAKDFFFSKVFVLKVDSSSRYYAISDWKYQKVHYPWEPGKTNLAVYFNPGGKAKLEEIRQQYKDFCDFIYKATRIYCSPDEEFEYHFLNGCKEHSISAKTYGDGYDGSAEVAFGKHYSEYVAWCKKLGIKPATVIYYD
jgi:hypothetical protein